MFGLYDSVANTSRGSADNVDKPSPPPVPMSSLHEAYGKNGVTMLK